MGPWIELLSPNLQFSTQLRELFPSLPTRSVSVYTKFLICSLNEVTVCVKCFYLILWNEVLDPVPSLQQKNKIWHLRFPSFRWIQQHFRQWMDDNWDYLVYIHCSLAPFCGGPSVPFSTPYVVSYHSLDISLGITESDTCPEILGRNPETRLTPLQTILKLVQNGLSKPFRSELLEEEKFVLNQAPFFGRVSNLAYPSSLLPILCHIPVQQTCSAAHLKDLYWETLKTEKSARN